MPTINIPELVFKPYCKVQSKVKISKKRVDKFIPREQDIFLKTNEKVSFLDSIYEGDKQSVRYYFDENGYCIITGDPWTHFEKALFLLIITKSQTMEVDANYKNYTYTIDYKNILNNFNFLNNVKVYNLIITSLQNIMNHNVDIITNRSTLYSRVVSSLSFSKYGIDILSTDIQISISFNEEVFRLVYINGFKQYLG